MKNIDKYDLLSNIISLINSEEFSATTASLAAACNVPLPYMRNTLDTLLRNQIIQSCISTPNDYADSSDHSFIEEFMDNPDRISEKIISGAYDDIEWLIDLKILRSGIEELLPLSHMEYGAVKDLGETLKSIKRASIYEKKETTSPVSASIRKNLETIQMAITNNQAISFTYKKSSNEIKQITVFPIRIITNLSDNWIYMQSSERKLYRLDRFIYPCQITSAMDSCPKYEEHPNEKYVWGAYFKEELTPTHVKVRISNETSNIISKIQRDTRLRKETCIFYQDGDYYYYEDDIVGMDEFQRWVRSYGSSMVVLEPESLRETIVARAKEALANYEKSNEWINL